MPIVPASWGPGVVPASQYGMEGAVPTIPVEQTTPALWSVAEYEPDDGPTPCTELTRKGEACKNPGFEGGRICYGHLQALEKWITAVEASQE